MGFEQEISDEELSAITEAISKKYGIDFTNYETKSLKRGFARLIIKHQMGSLVDLWTKIMAEPDIIPGLVDDHTVNLTELFRNEDAWKKITDDLLPQVGRFPTIKIFHAGCSSGEEVYSMAMILKEKNMLLRTRIQALDLSSKILNQAKEGKFSHLHMKKYGTALEKQFVNKKVEDFFDVKDGDAFIKPELKRKIDFKIMNLVSDDFKETGYHILFFRKVMIYFDDGPKEIS